MRSPRFFELRLGAIICAMVLASSVFAQARKPDRDSTERDTKRDLVVKFLKQEYPQALEVGTLARLRDDVVAETFPRIAFFTLRFRQWPVAYVVPEGLQPSNLCAVIGDRVILITGATELEAFFQQQPAPAVSEIEKRRAVIAWLHLSQELHQDGFYQFKPVRPASIILSRMGEDVQAQGAVEVLPTGGNQGKIAVTFLFDSAGDVKSIKERASLLPGIRPICQATKLLDPDPIVRQMAERDILVMGSIAEEYLQEQRAKASPELQEAIDLIWKRIQEEGR